jgi:hypothetical protein
MLATRELPEHEGSCPEAQIECPNAGCGETVVRCSMAEHRGGCGREEVACPCPGCEERMARSEVEEHVEASGAVHLWRAWRRVAEMEEKVADHAAAIQDRGKQAEEIAGLRGENERQRVEIAALHKQVGGQRGRVLY